MFVQTAEFDSVAQKAYHLEKNHYFSSVIVKIL